jgi:hypothetical protein
VISTAPVVTASVKSIPTDFDDDVPPF